MPQNKHTTKHYQHQQVNYNSTIFLTFWRKLTFRWKTGSLTQAKIGSVTFGNVFAFRAFSWIILKPSSRISERASLTISKLTSQQISAIYGVLKLKRQWKLCEFQQNSISFYFLQDYIITKCSPSSQSKSTWTLHYQHLYNLFHNKFYKYKKPTPPNWFNEQKI